MISQIHEGYKDIYLPRVYAINTLNAPKAKTHLGIGGYCGLSSLDAYK